MEKQYSIAYSVDLLNCDNDLLFSILVRNINLTVLHTIKTVILSQKV